MYDRLTNLLVEKRLNEFVSGDPTIKDRLKSAAKKVTRSVGTTPFSQALTGRDFATQASRVHGRARDAAIEKIPAAAERAGRAVGRTVKDYRDLASATSKVVGGVSRAVGDTVAAMRYTGRKPGEGRLYTPKVSRAKSGDENQRGGQQGKPNKDPLRKSPDRKVTLLRLKQAGLNPSDYKGRFDRPLTLKQRRKFDLEDPKNRAEIAYRAASTRSNLPYDKIPFLGRLAQNVAQTRFIRTIKAAQGRDPRTGIERALAYQGLTPAGAIVKAFKRSQATDEPGAPKSVY